MGRKAVADQLHGGVESARLEATLLGTPRVHRPRVAEFGPAQSMPNFPKQICPRGCWLTAYPSNSSSCRSTALAAIGAAILGDACAPPHCSLSAVELLRSYPVLSGHASASNMMAMAIAATRPEGVRRGGGGCVVAESFSTCRSMD
jgi:hypothetical protein